MARDIANEYTNTLTVYPRNATKSFNGTGVDFNDHGPEVTAHLQYGIFEGGTTLAVKLQESDDNDSYSDITGGAFTSVADTDGNDSSETITIFNRSKRYVRAAVTLSGASPDVHMAVLLQGRKTSY